MSNYTKTDQLIEMVKYGNTGEYSHLIIYSDHFDYSYGSRYVKVDEDVEKVIENILSHGSAGMFTIEEVYNYYLDLEKQFCERGRVKHIEPKTKKVEEYEVMKEVEEAGMEEVKKIVDKIKDENKENTPFTDKLKEAILYADKIHKKQKRKGSDMPYINHPIAVMENVLKYSKHSDNLESLLIIACLHDVLEDAEDKEKAASDIFEKFGSKILFGVMELTSDKTMQHELGKEKYLALKMTEMSSDILTIKLCDRLSNVNDLESSNNKEFIAKYRKESTGILRYLLDNRELNDIQKKIIKDIGAKLLNIKVEDDYDEAIINIIEKCSDDGDSLQTEFMAFLNNSIFDGCSYTKRRN